MTRRFIVCLSALALFTLTLPTGMPPRVRVVYNASASAPLGWYLIDSTAAITQGDYVIVRLPHSLAAMAEQRGYLPAHVPLLKRVAAVAGAIVCVQGDDLYIDGAPRVRLLRRDAQGRELPRLMPCRALLAEELLLLNTEHAGSFDSRYFGPVSTQMLRGKAVPLWTWRSP